MTLATRGWERVQQLTNEHMNDPHVGDEFHEMYNYWIRVTARNGQSVTTLEGVSGQGKTKQYKSIAEFQTAFRYSTNPGYYVQFYEKNSPSSVG